MTASKPLVDEFFIVLQHSMRGRGRAIHRCVRLLVSYKVGGVVQTQETRNVTSWGRVSGAIPERLWTGAHVHTVMSVYQVNYGVPRACDDQLESIAHAIF
jgi:hypothetical protein